MKLLQPLPTCLLIIFFVCQSCQDVPVTSDGLLSESHHDLHQEIIVDSLISQSRHVEPGRELKPWVPDEDELQCPELEDIFDGHWNRLLSMTSRIISFLET